MVRVGRDAVKVIWRAARLTSRGLEPVVLRGRGKRGAPPRLILICMSSLPSRSVFVHPSAGPVCVNAPNVESVKAKGEGRGGPGRLGPEPNWRSLGRKQQQHEPDERRLGQQARTMGGARRASAATSGLATLRSSRPIPLRCRVAHLSIKRVVGDREACRRSTASRPPAFAAKAQHLHTAGAHRLSKAAASLRASFSFLRTQSASQDGAGGARQS